MKKGGVMETNIGRVDQLIRIAVMVIAAVLFLTHRDTGFTSTVAGIIVIYSFMTALTKYSPLWEILGISTENKTHKEKYKS